MQGTRQLCACAVTVLRNLSELILESRRSASLLLYTWRTRRGLFRSLHTLRGSHQGQSTLFKEV